jgi:hypothetical protein
VLVTDKRKVLSVEEKVKLMREIENGKQETKCCLSGICSCKFYDPKICENRSKTVSAFEQNESRMK